MDKGIIKIHKTDESILRFQEREPTTESHLLLPPWLNNQDFCLNDYFVPVFFCWRRCFHLSPFPWAKEVLLQCFSPCISKVGLHGFQSKIVILWHVKLIWFSVPLENLAVPPLPWEVHKKVVLLLFKTNSRLKKPNKINQQSLNCGACLAVLRFYNEPTGLVSVQQCG